MENGFDRAEIVSCHNLSQKVIAVHVVSNVEIHQILELAAIFQVVDNQNVVYALLIERFYNVAADHASAASYDDHL